MKHAPTHIKLMQPEHFDFESRYSGYIYIDESGRGNIASEMVFTGVKVLGDVSFATDSKKLTGKQISGVVDRIKENVQYFSVITTSTEIDLHGLSASIKKSLESIINHFGENEKYLYDGNKTFGVDNHNLETLVKADALVKGVGAASIIAKHTKDALLLVHHEEYPMYNWDKNAGYATKDHIEAIKKYGFTKYHRMSYNVKELAPYKPQQSKKDSTEDINRNEKIIDFLF